MKPARWRITRRASGCTDSKFYGRTLKEVSRKVAKWVWKGMQGTHPLYTHATLLVSVTTDAPKLGGRPCWVFVETVEVLR